MKQIDPELLFLHSQAPYNTIEYYFVNSIDAVRFFIDPEVGQIFVRRNLVGESAAVFNVSTKFTVLG